MSKMALQWIEQCKHCNGTGLFIGMGEMAGREDYGGAAVVCNKCKGTGRMGMRHEYEEFAGRQLASVTVKRVWACNPGIMLHADKCSGGVPVIAWQIRGDSPQRLGNELRSHTCPAWWNQTAGIEQPKWSECILGGRFSDCKHFDNRASCWERWDKERGADDTQLATKEYA